MALSAALEDLLKELEKTDPAAAKTQRTLLEGNEKVAKALEPYVLRQSDYDRFMNENKGKLNKFDEREAWYNKAKPTFDQTVKDLKTSQERIAELEKAKGELEEKIKGASITAAAAAAAEGGGDVDPAKIAEAVRASLGDDIPTKDALHKLIQDKTVELVKANYETAVKKFYDEDFPKAALFSSQFTDAQIRYFQETGKRLDPKEYSKFLKENAIASPEAGYEKFMEPVRRQTEIAAEVDKRVKDEIAKRNSSGDFPGSSGSPQPMGALQVRLQKRSEGDPLIPKDAELGDNSLAFLAAKELREEGKIA
jgi:hypothetical protein